MNSSTQFDSDAAQVLQEEMMQGESILWCGRPLRRIVFHRSDWVMVPFSLVWGGMTLSFLWEQVKTTGRLQGFQFNDIVLIAFAFMGQYFIWGRFLYDTWKKTRVLYGVTNRRILVVVRGRSRKLIDRPLLSLDLLDLTVRADGAGTVSFSNPLTASGTLARRGNSTNFGLQLESLNFYDIPDARGVYKLIRDHRDQELRLSS